MIKKILPHLSIVVSMIMLTLYALNSINSAMGFLKGDEFEALLLVFCAVSLTTSIVFVVENRKNDLT